MRMFSMFTGIGGFEKGFEDVYGKDLEVVGFSEIDKYAISVYKYHYAGVKNYGNARNVKPGELPEFDILTAGFPCQSFSIAGKRGGFEDTRGTLFFEIARIVAVKRPQLLLLENVKGLLSHDSGVTFGTILATLSGMGYVCEWQVLNSKDFGVPQNRERIFIVGHLGTFRKQTVFPIRKSYSEAEGIQRQERKEGKRIPGELHKAESGKERTEGGRERCEQSGGAAENDLKLVGKLPTKYDQQSRIYSTEGISSTLQTGEVGYYKTESNIRRLTPIECERLQGYPDNWTAEGTTGKISDSQRYKMCGNSVTVNVIAAIAKAIKTTEAE